MQRFSKFLVVLIGISLLITVVGCTTKTPGTTTKNEAAKTADVDLTNVSTKVENIIGVLPKFAIPMREYGDRYDNLWYAAKGGNWGLAAYMEKYMRKAMKPASVTKPDMYNTLQTWEKANLDPLVDTIMKKDFAAFDKQYTATIAECNKCHDSTGYKFVVYKKPTKPADVHLDYTAKSEPTDVPK